jgi:hypothetical protein
MSAGKPPTFARYQKVEAVLEDDRAIKAKLGAKTEIVCKPPPSVEKVKFSKPVVYITEQIHANGVDAHTVSKGEIIKMAFKLLQAGNGEFKLPEREVLDLPEPEAKAIVPKPKPAKPAKPEAAPVAKPAVKPAVAVKPAAKPVVVVKPVVKPVVVAKPAAPAPKVVPPVQKAAPAPAPKTVAAVAKPLTEAGKAAVAAAASAQKSPVLKAVQAKKITAPVEETTPPKTEPITESPHAEVGQNACEAKDKMFGFGPKSLAAGFPLSYGVCAVTLLMAVDQLMDVQDNFPGKKDRLQKLSELIKDYQALTIIPKSAKEA